MSQLLIFLALAVFVAVLMRKKRHRPNKKFTPKPTDGCADCEWLTEEVETTSVCDECFFEQRAEYTKMLDNPYRY